MIAALTVLVLALATGGPAVAAKGCGSEVLDDWTEDSRLNKTYRIECYDQALENLPNDVADYTDAFDQISDARQDALQGKRVLSRFGGDDDDPGAGSNSVVDDVLGVGSGGSDSIPLPLIILAGLAGLLMAAGGAGLLARKLQNRRPD